jgi:hypothetical protein
MTIKRGEAQNDEDDSRKRHEESSFLVTRSPFHRVSMAKFFSILRGTQSMYPRDDRLPMRPPISGSSA